jgi:hypothetical protein
MEGDHGRRSRKERNEGKLTDGRDVDLRKPWNKEDQRKSSGRGLALTGKQLDGLSGDDLRVCCG